MNVSELQLLLREFAQERDWEKFHNPKNLAAALVVEAGELLEVFQWLTPEESAAVMADPEGAARVREEVADVLIYALRLTDVLGIDLEPCIRGKIERNAEKYPVDSSRGTARRPSRS